MTYGWNLLFSVPGCHRWFRDGVSGRVAPCDQSGPTPDKTDDRVLWLDPLVEDFGGSDFRIKLKSSPGAHKLLGGTNRTELNELKKQGLIRVERF